jgi:hypothetical protein
MEQCDRFFAEVSRFAAEELHDAVGIVRKRFGMKTFSKADVAEAMIVLFSELARAIDLAGHPRKTGRNASAFRQFLKDRIVEAVRKG